MCYQKYGFGPMPLFCIDITQQIGVKLLLNCLLISNSPIMLPEDFSYLLLYFQIAVSLLSEIVNFALLINKPFDGFFIVIVS